MSEGAADGVSGGVSPGLRTVVHRDAAALGTAVAAVVREALERTREQGRQCLVGVPAGRTLRPVLAALERDLGGRPLPLDHLVVVMMDDYLAPAGPGSAAPLRRVDPGAAHSCWRFGREEVLDALAAAGGGAAGPLGPGALWSPDPQDPAAYDEQVAAAGGVELFLVAVGAGDGHVALNPPGSALDGRTRVLQIADTTRRDNLATFPTLRSLDDVPTHGVTVGLGSIAASRHVVALAHGAGKADVVARVLAADGPDPALPATFLHAVPGAVLHLDAAAAGRLGPVGALRSAP